MLHIDIAGGHASRRREILERLLPLGWTAAGMALLYLVWVFASRDLAPVPAARKTPEPLLAWLQGSEPRIAAFYSAPSVVRGSQAVLCYGVLNVRSVRLEPPVDRITPSINRCISVSPAQTTTYSQVAQGNDGRELRESLTIQVVPPAPSFLFASISSKEIARGERFALCYGVKDAVSVTLKPSFGIATPPSAKRCVMFYPPVTTKFELTAAGEDGRSETLRFAVAVLDKKRK